MKKYLLFVFIILFCQITKSQVDKEFWFAPPFITHFHGEPGGKPVFLQITAHESDANVVVEWPANPFSSPITVKVKAHNFVKINLDSLMTRDNVTGAFINNQLLTYPPATPVPFGMHIFSDSDVSIVYYIDNHLNREMYILKGTNALGNYFCVPFQNLFFNQHNSYEYFDLASSIDIVAVEDNTVITVTLPDSQLVKMAINDTALSGKYNAAYISKSVIVGTEFFHSSGDTFSFTLNRGQSYSIRAMYYNYYNHLGGTIIRTNGKKIAVNITDDSVNGIKGCYDLIGDQLIPADLCGSNYILMSSHLDRTVVNGVRILEGWSFVAPTQPNTKIYVNSKALDGVYNPGDNVAVGIPLNCSFALLKTVDANDTTINRPSCVLNVGGVDCEFGGAIIPSIDNCNGSNEVTFFRSNRTEESSFINLIVRDGAQDAFRLIINCDSSINICDTINLHESYFEKIIGTGTFGDKMATSNRGIWILKEQYKSIADILDANGYGTNLPSIITFTNSKDYFQLSIASGQFMKSAVYSYYSKFNQLNTKKNYDSKTKPIYLCSPEDTATLEMISGFFYEWFYDADGSGANLSKKYLDPNHYVQSKCNAYGFELETSDIMKDFYFRCNINRGLCMGDTSVSIKVTVYKNASTDFTVSDSNVCSGVPITFTNKTDSFPDQLLTWTFKSNDSNKWQTINTKNKKFNYSFYRSIDSTDFDTVEVMLLNQYNNCYGKSIKKIIIMPSPKAMISTNTVFGCSPLDIELSDSSKGILTNRIWYFGDGDSSLIQDPTHLFLHNGKSYDTSYLSILKVTNINGCESVDSSKIFVIKLNSSIICDTLTVCSPNTGISFSSETLADSILWSVHHADGSKTILNSIKNEGNIILPQNYSFTLRTDTLIQYAFGFERDSSGIKKSIACLDSSIKLITIYPEITCPDTLKKHFLDVINGQGDGLYKYNATVSITADSISGKVFDKWIGDTELITDTLQKNILFKMPARDITLSATYKTLYKLIIGNGTGSGFYPEGTPVTIKADTMSYKIFINWQGDLEVLNNIYKDSISFMMPSQDVTLEAGYNSLYFINLLNGIGSGFYPAGSKITITADEIPGMVFIKWTGDNQWLDDSTNQVAIITIPNDIDPFKSLPKTSYNISIKAAYKNLRELVIHGGNGSGSYIEGSNIIISSYNDVSFQMWTGDTTYLDDKFSPTTIVHMPDTNITLYALEKNSFTDNTFNSIIYPIPASEILYLKHTLGIRCVKLYSIEGIVVFEDNNLSPIYSMVLNLSSLSSGLYFLKVTSTNGNTEIFNIPIIK